MKNYVPDFRVVPKTIHMDGEYELYPSKPTIWSLEQQAPGGTWYVVKDYYTPEGARAACLNYMEAHYAATR